MHLRKGLRLTLYIYGDIDAVLGELDGDTVFELGRVR